MLVALVGMVASTSTTSAQMIRTAYFMDKATVRTSLNPALQPGRGYIAFPVIGSLNVGFATNGIALSDLLYSRNGQLVTFMDASVPTSDFLSALKPDNQINTEFALNILSAGWFSQSGFWTIGLSTKGNISADVPKALFEFMKYGSGTEGKSYDIRNLHLYADSYAEASIGYSRSFGKRLTLGLKYKFLIGAANADIYFDQMTAVMQGDSWRITSQGHMSASMKGLTPSYDEEEGYMSGFDLDKPGIGGYGSAIDLGATYKLLPNLTLSAAILDLGFIKWHKEASTYGVAQGEFRFEGFQLPIGDNNDTPSISDQLDDLTNDLERLFHFQQTESQSRTTMLRSTINIGAEYSVLNNKISFGLLSSTRIYKPKTYTELTLSANFRPVSWFALTGSYSFLHSDFETFGLALNFSPSWIHFFVGTDYMITKVTPQYVPVNASAANVYFGLGIPLGRAKQDR